MPDFDFNISIPVTFYVVENRERKLIRSCVFSDPDAAAAAATNWEGCGKDHLAVMF